MIKFRLKYNIELILDCPEDGVAPIQWVLPRPELSLFKSELEQRINSMIGLYGHILSSTAIGNTDFVSAIKRLKDWNPEMIACIGVDPNIYNKVPLGTIS